jgi:hypothetical protein
MKTLQEQYQEHVAAGRTAEAQNMENDLLAAQAEAGPPVPEVSTAESADDAPVDLSAQRGSAAKPEYERGSDSRLQ